MKAIEQKEFLLSMSKNPDYDQLNDFIANNGKIDIKLNGAKQTLLHLAVSENNLKLIEWLLKNGADANLASYHGATPIFIVKTVEAARLLIRFGADLDAIDKKGYSILYFHIAFKEKELTQFLSQQMNEDWLNADFELIEPMNEEEYWKIVEKNYRFGKGDERKQASEIVRDLRYKDPREIIAFQKRTYILSNHAHTSTLWAAAYVLNGGCSDDAFIDFKHWVISLGKNPFYKTIEKPDTLIRFWEKQVRFHNYGNIDCPGIAYSAQMAYEYRTGLDNFYKVADYSNTGVSAGKFELDWDSSTIEKKKDDFPKIWKAYWKQ